MSLSPRYSLGMIDLGTLSGLFEHQHSLAAYCQHCDRRAVLNLATMVEAGHGERRLPITVRRQVCGEIGRLHVRPPVPTLDSHRAGWISPH